MNESLQRSSNGTHVGKVRSAGRDLPPWHVFQHLAKDPLPALELALDALPPVAQTIDSPCDSALGGAGGTDLEAVEEFRDLGEEERRGEQAAEAVAGDGVAPVCRSSESV